MFCHSYGSVVCGLAAARLKAKDLVVFGSPGMRADNAAELGTSARVWAAKDPSDWIGKVPHIRFLGLGHGTDPASEEFGARYVPARDAREPLRLLRPGHGIAAHVRLDRGIGRCGMSLVERIERATPEHRDRAVDGLRALALLAVPVGHWLIGGFTLDEQGALHNASPLSTLAYLAPASWVLQMLGIFFLVGGYASALSYRRRTGAAPGGGCAAGWSGSAGQSWGSRRCGPHS